MCIDKAIDYFRTAFLQRVVAGLLLAGSCMAGTAWADETSTESATSRYMAPFAMAHASAAASHAVATPKQVEKAVQASLTDDQRIAAEVIARLARNPLFADVRVSVHGSVVLLEGKVRNADAKALATKLAESVKGVVAVDNGLVLSTNLAFRLDDATQKVRDRLVQLVSSIPIFLLALMVLALANWLGRWLAAHPRILGFRLNYGNTYFQSLVRRGIRIAFMAGGFLIAMDLLDSTALVGALLGSVSIIGVTLGFAFRGVAENYIAGVLLSLRSPFEPGDHVVIGSHEGKVASLSARSTVLITLNGEHLRLPNAMVFSQTILNYSRNNKRRFSFILGISMREDLAKAQRLGVHTLIAMKGILENPPPKAVIRQIHAPIANVEYFAWIDQNETDFISACSEGIRMVRGELKKAGIDIPEPTYRVQLMEGSWSSTESGKAVTAVRTRPVTPQAPVDKSTEIDEQIAEIRSRQKPEDDLLTPRDEQAAEKTIQPEKTGDA